MLNKQLSCRRFETSRLSVDVTARVISHGIPTKVRWRASYLVKSVRLLHNSYNSQTDSTIYCSDLRHTFIALQWRHNERDGLSNHRRRGCLLNRLFRRRSQKTSKLRVTGLCEGIQRWPVNSPHKGPVTRKMVPFDDAIMECCILGALVQVWRVAYSVPSHYLNHSELIINWIPQSSEIWLKCIRRF